MLRISFFLLFIPLLNFSQSQRIDSVLIEGIYKMNKQFIEKQINCKPNSVLDSVLIAKDITILNRLNGVSFATFRLIKNAAFNYNLTYTIQENFSVIPLLSLWTTADVAAFRLGLYDYNFLGKNNTIGAFYQNNFFNSFGFNFASPQFFSKKVGVGFNFQNLSTKEPIFFETTSAIFKYANISSEIFLNYQVNFYHEFAIGFTAFKEKYDFLEGEIDSETPLNLNLNKKLVKLRYTYDNLKYNYFLLDGFKINSYFQYVFTENNVQEKFSIVWTDFLYYKKFARNSNFATRLRLGLATNTKTPFAPFAVDNNLNIRGVGNIIDRGTGIIVLNTEFRKTIFEKNWFVLQGNTFVDSGTWRNPGGNFSDFGEQINLRVYPGVGLRFIHKTIFNAVFRLDYGYGITKNASDGIVFGVGQYF